MLDDYKEEQPIIYKILLNAVKKNKYSHAYLFELNGYSKGLDIAKAFAKYLVCPNNYSNCDNCINCSQCRNIDNNNFLEVKIIDSDGQWIKKEQLEELQREFMKKSLIGNKKVYIINNAEKMNVSSSNSLLKFIEEPPEGIIAILITNNMYQLLNTIISRCQILSFMKKKYVENTQNSIEKIADFLFSDKNSRLKFIEEDANTYIETVINYIDFLENRKNETIVYKNKEFLNIFNDRKFLNIAFELFVLYYKDVLNILLDVKCEYFFDYTDELKKISKLNTIESLSYKIKKLVEYNVNIKYNLNSNLLMDKMVIEFSKE